jgi:DNA modification methylase
MVIDAVEPDPPYDEGYKKGKAYPAARWLDYVEQEENWAKYGIKRRA